jgi:hypothetical protein
LPSRNMLLISDSVDGISVAPACHVQLIVRGIAVGRLSAGCRSCPPEGQEQQQCSC